ncbi:MAG: class D sortase [Terriglobales bacterium]
MGIVALLYCAITAAEATLYQEWAYRQLRAATAQTTAVPSGTRYVPLDSVPDRSGAYADAGQGAPVAELEIPRIHVTAMVAEGASARVLRIAVGHVPGTALPGQAGNVGLAAHRDSFFRQVGKLTAGDVIRLTTRNGQYEYRVGSTAIVGPEDVSVLNPSPNQTLTLVTCYPFYFVGSAPKRFIVRANRL